jgi:hypothetical protein
MKPLLINNFCDLVNDVLVEVINNNHEIIISQDGSTLLLNERFIRQSVIEMNSLLKKMEGSHRIVVHSCHPNDNWRNVEQIELCHYLPTYLETNNEKFDWFYHELWSKLIKKKHLICISNPRLDYYDILKVIDEHIISVYINEEPSRSEKYITNGNEYFDHSGPIEQKFKTQLEIELATHSLIHL